MGPVCAVGQEEGHVCWGLRLEATSLGRLEK